MNSGDYYADMRRLAAETRTAYALTGLRVARSDMRRVYRDQGITIDYWPYALRRLRGSYHNDEYGVTVMVAKNLPDDPAIFTLAHELKHHLVDQDKIVSLCDSSNSDELIEVGAEVFAAEFLLPTHLMAEWFESQGIGLRQLTPAELVRFKRESATTLSYAGLVKSAERLNLMPKGEFARVQWKKLEESIYGVPFYKRLSRGRAG